MAESQLTVSLEPHLINYLRALHHVLPSNLGERLVEYVPSSADSPVRPDGLESHILLHDLSRWTLTLKGTEALEKSGLALRAGTKASPEKHFPTSPGRVTDCRGNTRQIAQEGR
jgi:hypothetical protein